MDHIALRIDSSDDEEEHELAPMIINQPIPIETNPPTKTLLPRDIIYEICKFLPTETMLEVCLVNHDWFEACLEDDLWIPFLPSWKVKRLPKNMKKGELRKIVIKEGKENAKAKISWKRGIQFENRKDRVFEWMNKNFNRAVNFTVFCVYICFVVFVSIMALRDVNTSITAHALTSVWFAYTMLFSLWLFFILAKCCGRFENSVSERLEVVIFTAILVVVSVQMLLLHLKLAIEYINMSWFAVMSPTYAILAVITCIISISGISQSLSSEVIVKFITSLLLIIFSVLVAFVGDGYIHLAFSFIPLYFSEMLWVYVYYKHKDMTTKRKYLLIVLLISLMICEIILSLGEFLHSYVWFAWLLPLTISSVMIWTRNR